MKSIGQCGEPTIVMPTTSGPDGRFQDGSPGTESTTATQISAEFLNSQLEEFKNIIAENGEDFRTDSDTQLLRAIRRMINASSLKTDCISGLAMAPAMTNGTTDGTFETPVNRRTIPAALFPSGADSAFEAQYFMPEDWDRGPLKARVEWVPEDGATIGDEVTFILKAASTSSGESLDVAFTSGVTITDTAKGDNRGSLSPASSGLTVEGDPASGDLIMIRLERDVDAGSSPMSVGARVLCIWIQYTCNTVPVAW